MFDRKVFRHPLPTWAVLLAALLWLALPGPRDVSAQTVEPAGGEPAGAAGAPPAPFAIRVMRDGTEIEFSGEFARGAAREFIKTARGLRRLRVVHLSSNGGSVAEGEMLYQYIKKRKLKTYVSSECLSACAFAFAGGRERWIGRFGRLGYHSPSGAPDEVAAAKEIIASAMHDGFGWTADSRAFVERALAVPYEEMWVPETSELVAARMVSAVSDGSHFALSGVGRNVTPDLLAESMSAQHPAIAALRDRHPAEAAEIFANLQHHYEKGDSEAVFAASFLESAMRIVEADLPLSDDDVIYDMIRIGNDQAKALGVINPALCTLYFKGEDSHDVAARLPAELVTRGLDVVERVLRTARPRPMAAGDSERIAVQVVTEFQKRVPEGDLTPPPPNSSTMQDKSFCDANIALFEIVLELDVAEAAAFIRLGAQPASDSVEATAAPVQ